MDLPSAGPARPRSRRSISTLAKVSTTTGSKGDEWREHFGKPAAGASLQAPQGGHRHSRSVHHHSHHHLHLHGNHTQTRQRSHTYGKAGTESYLATDGAMDRLKKVGSRAKDHSGLSNTSGHIRRNTGNVTLVTGEMQALQMARMSARVMREKQLALARNSELRDVYQNISDVSMESIHKLDDVYYSILERLSTLQHTIGGLQVLSMQTKDLKTTFDEEAKQIGEDVDKQIVTFGGFSKQKMRIEQLESRIHEGRARTERLTERLEVARDRVQNLENQEAEVQASISFQFRIVWFVLGGIATVVIALLLANYFIPLPNRELIDGPLSASILSSSAIDGVDFTPSPSPAPNDVKNDRPAELISSLTEFMMRRSSEAALIPIPTPAPKPTPFEETQKTSCAVSSGNADAAGVCTTSSISLEEDPRLKLFEEL